jgi:hypothetical protein
MVKHMVKTAGQSSQQEHADFSLLVKGGQHAAAGLFLPVKDGQREWIYHAPLVNLVNINKQACCAGQTLSGWLSLVNRVAQQSHNTRLATHGLCQSAKHAASKYAQRCLLLRWRLLQTIITIVCDTRVDTKPAANLPPPQLHYYTSFH